MSSTVKPTPIALVVCDSIYQEQPGGKAALVGLFDKLYSRTVPVRHPRMAVFASVTGLRKDSRVKLDIVNAEDETVVVVAAEGEFSGDGNPLAIVDMNFVFNNLVFKELGTYYIRFWGNGHLLMQRPFEVKKTPEK